MKNFTRIILAILGLALMTQSVQAVSYPNTTPTNEVRGGYFMLWFENAFEPCPAGHAIAGFKFDRSDITNLENGKRICVPIGAQTTVVQQGSNNTPQPQLPVLASGLTPEAFETLKESLRLLLRDQLLQDVYAKVTTDIIAQIENSVTQKAVGQAVVLLEKNLTEKLLTVINNTFEELKKEQFKLQGENDTLALWGSGGTALTSSVITQKNGNIAVGHKDPQAKLDIAGKIRIADGTQGSGSVLVSDAKGLARWLSPKDILISKSCVVPGVGNVCHGENALQKNTSGQSNVGIGVSALRDNTTGDGNTAVGSSALQKNQSGTNNTAIGRNAGSELSSGEYNILIGAGVEPQKNNGSHQLNIGNWIYGKEGNISVGEKEAPNGVKMNVKGSLRIADGSHGSGKILVSDQNGVARWEDISAFKHLAAPASCPAEDQVVGPRTYAVPVLAEGITQNITLIIPISNGNVVWTQAFSCQGGQVKVIGSEQSNIQCNAGFQSNGTACVPPTSVGPTGCPAVAFPLNGKTYQVNDTKHNFTTVAYADTTIPNGVVRYQQTFRCNAGVLTAEGNEEIASRTCNPGFAWDGNSCIAGGPGNAGDLAEAFKDTQCDISQVQVVTITPGHNKIPEQLSPNTLYKLQPGLYQLTRGVQLPECSSIMGAGKDQTTIQYTGLAHGIPYLFSIDGNGVSIVKAKISGQEQGKGAVRTMIFSQGRERIVLRDLILEDASQYLVHIPTKGSFHITNILLLQTLQDRVSGLYLEGDNSVIKNIEARFLDTDRSGGNIIRLKGNNNTVENLKGWNAGDSLSYSVAYFEGNSTISGIKIYNSTGRALELVGAIKASKIDIINASGHGIKTGGNAIDISNVRIANVTMGMHLEYGSVKLHNAQIMNARTGIRFERAAENAFSNVVIGHTDEGIKVESNRNLFRNVLVYKSKKGLVMNGFNNAMSNLRLYGNETAIEGDGQVNFYYDLLSAFDNTNGNDILPLEKGRAGDWVSGFANGELSQNGTFLQDMAIVPNVAGFDVNTIGVQSNLDWPENTQFTYGSWIPYQVAPFLNAECNVASTSNSKCAPTFGDASTYNATRKIGQW